MCVCVCVCAGVDDISPVGLKAPSGSGFILKGICLKNTSSAMPTAEPWTKQVGTWV